MNSDTYSKLMDFFIQYPEARKALVDTVDTLADELSAITIDESIPDGMVRLAGDRYVSREQFQRMLRKEARRRK